MNAMFMFMFMFMFMEVEEMTYKDALLEGSRQDPTSMPGSLRLVVTAM
jgi:hypothetical protein